jgi:hypothetical protein
VGGGQQVGSGIESKHGYYHALLWSGTAASMVDLHPVSGFEDSWAADTDGTHQVGYATSLGPNAGYHASLWSGTAASLVDLHPAGGFFLNSSAIGLSSNQQVG